jgi:Tol biopolymer transport system component
MPRNPNNDRMAMQRYKVFLAALIIIAAGCGDVSEVEIQMVSKIVFTVGGEEGTNIFVMDSDGSNKKQLTDTSYRLRQPVWSPDGSKVLYSANGDGDWAAYSMDPDGSNVRKIPNTEGFDDAAWTNDNQIICYTGQPETGGRGLFTLNTNGTGRVRLPTGSDNDAYSTWSPIISRLTFESGRDGNSEIYVMNSDGSGLIRLTENPNLDEWPSLSRDGTKIAYASGIEGDKDIWIVNSDGSNRMQVTSDVAIGDAFPSWSPDGTHIVFTTNTEIFMINIDGTGLTKIADGAQPSWSPYLQ